MSAKKLNKNLLQLFIYTSILFLLILTSANVNSYLTPEKVLGAGTQDFKDEEFWNDFLSKNPDYIPGWVEIGREDKVQELNPNHITP